MWARAPLWTTCIYDVCGHEKFMGFCVCVCLCILIHTDGEAILYTKMSTYIVSSSSWHMDNRGNADEHESQTHKWGDETHTSEPHQIPTMHFARLRYDVIASVLVRRISNIERWDIWANPNKYEMPWRCSIFDDGGRRRSKSKYISASTVINVYVESL